MPGARDLIIDGAIGLLVPPPSPQQMTVSILSPIDNPKRLEALVKASREHTIQDFSVKIHADSFVALFRSTKKVQTIHRFKDDGYKLMNSYHEDDPSFHIYIGRTGYFS